MLKHITARVGDIDNRCSGRSSVVVADSNTAITLGSGSVPVFGTPALVALMESAACACVAPQLKSGETTVGSVVNITHLAPSIVGRKIEVCGCDVNCLLGTDLLQ